MTAAAAFRRRQKPAGKVLIDVMIQSRLWKAQPGAAAIVRRAVNAAANAASTARAELAIVLTDDSAIHALNREWRGHDAPTNVLSFPAGPPQGLTHGRNRITSAPPAPLGDIVIAYETTAREAAAEGKPLKHHLVHLAIHGFLHLLGYDHETKRDAGKMESFEVAILAKLGVPDPYATRQAGP